MSEKVLFGKRRDEKPHLLQAVTDGLLLLGPKMNDPDLLSRPRVTIFHLLEEMVSTFWLTNVICLD